MHHRKHKGVLASAAPGPYEHACGVEREQMRTIGLIFLAAGDTAALTAGGITIAERQTRQLRRAGAEAVLVLDAPPLSVIPPGTDAVTQASLPAAVGEGDRVLVVARGLIVDERALAAVAAAPVPALLVSDATRPGAGGVERLDALTLAGGVAAVRGSALVALLRTLGDWDLESTLTRALATDATRVEATAIPLYAPDRRRAVPLLWARPQTAAEARVADRAIIAAAQKGCLDWPARFIHPLIEDTLVRLLAPTPVTPNLVTLATGVIGVAAMAAFAMGWLWTALILALITGPLDGVDGKLARTRVEFSRWGDLEHLIDKILEYGWYAAAAAWFARTMGSALPWAIAALIIVPALAEAIQGEFFRRFTGVQLDDAGRVERRIRLVAGRRNTFLWTWLPFAAVGLWFAGFVALAVYSVVTTGAAQWRFYKRLGAYGRDHSAAVATNFTATGYGFLPSKAVSSN